MADPALIHQVVTTTGLSYPQAERVVDDVLSFYSQTVEDFVRDRHAELKAGGVRNTEAFGVIAAELGDRVVRAPQLTHRQIRRVIYG